jgi:hypothetical protein
MPSRVRCGPDVDQKRNERRRLQDRDALTCSVGWWACQDLNLGPHPYQQNAGNRCAKRPFRRSRPTVEGEVMCSHRVQLCALVLPSLRLGDEAALRLRAGCLYGGRPARKHRSHRTRVQARRGGVSRHHWPGRSVPRSCHGRCALDRPSYARELCCESAHADTYAMGIARRRHRRRRASQGKCFEVRER